MQSFALQTNQECMVNINIISLLNNKTKFIQILRGISHYSNHPGIQCKYKVVDSTLTMKQTNLINSLVITRMKVKNVLEKLWN